MMMPFVKSMWGNCLFFSTLQTSSRIGRLHRRHCCSLTPHSSGSNTMTAAILYHYPCPDGAFAALAAHLYFSAVNKPVKFFPNLVYNAIRVEELPFADFEEVYLLDMVGPEGFVNELCAVAKRVVVLDHHVTAMRRFEANEYSYKNIHCVIDMTRSAATIAYDYFTEKLSSASKESHTNQENMQVHLSLVPETDKARVNILFRYIEDADLWRWALPDSKAFSCGLKDMQIEFSTTKNDELFEQLSGLNPTSLIEKGKHSILTTSKLIEESLTKAFVVRLGNGQFGRCLALYVKNDMANLRSELGNALAKKSRSMNQRAIGAVVYEVEELVNDGKLKVSLRSFGAEDTTTISEAYQGGGHVNASSFLIDRKEFLEWKK